MNGEQHEAPAPPERADPLLDSDRAAREAAGRDFQRPMVLEAGAGTGKTHTLVERVISWALSGGWRGAERALGGRDTDSGSDERLAARVMERIVAITFTERAAAELSERIASGLAERTAESQPPAVRRRAFALLAAVDLLGVSTIHGYCRRLLAAYPLEAGVRPGFEVDGDGTLVEAVVDELMVEQLPAAYGDPGDEDLLALAEEGIGPREIAKALVGLVQSGTPAEALGADPFAAARVAACVSRLRSAAQALRYATDASLRSARDRRLARALEAHALLVVLDRELEGAERPESLVACVASERLGALMEVLQRWRRAEFTDVEQERFAEMAASVAEASAALYAQLRHLQAVDVGLLRRALAALEPRLREVSRRLRCRGVVSFAELLRGARDLLRDHPGVLRDVQRACDQLLVDEFQDTDPLQCELIELLAFSESSGQQPALMVVGDPKQSIYGWRSADLAAYERFVERATAAGGAVHRLSVNHRSVGAILDEVTRLMRPVMRAEPGMQPAYRRLIAAERPTERAALPPGRSGVEHWVSWALPGQQPDGAAEGPAGPETSAVRARALEARAIARDLRDMVVRGDLRWGQAALLLRTTTHQEIYLEALREHGVPFVVERDRSYFRRREIIDAAALLRAVLDPTDQVALLTWMRSTAVGVPDAALVALWREQLPDLVSRADGLDPELLERIDAAIERAAAQTAARASSDRVGGWPGLLAAGVRVLARLRADYEQLPSDVFVERVRRLTLLEPLEAARYLGAYREANLARFFRELRDELARSVGGPHAQLRWLRRAVAEQRDEEAATLGDETLEAVRVLTIHKAKGLTFDHVYVADLHGQPRGDHGAPLVDGAQQDGLWEMVLFGAPSLGFDRVRRRRAKVAEAEAVRTLYVAVTRPRDRLVLVGRWPDPAERGRVGSHVALVSQRAGERVDLLGLWRRAEQGDGAELVDADGCRWRVLGARGEAAIQREREHEHEHDGEHDGEHDDADQEPELLAAARVRAAARMGRALIGTASTMASHDATDSALGLDQARETTPVAHGDPAAGQAGARTARAAGTLVHAALEHLDLQAGDLRAALALQSRSLERYLVVEAPQDRDPALALARELLERIGGGPLLGRLSELREAVIGREIPLALGPQHERDGLLATTGSIDLLYRDPADGTLVVADYKTDRVDAPEAVQRRCHHYAPQGEVYRRGVASAFDEPDARFELWFIWSGRIVEA